MSSELYIPETIGKLLQNKTSFHLDLDTIGLKMYNAETLI